MTTKTFAKRFNAQRAARKLLGETAQEGVTFRTFKAPNGEWDFEAMAAGEPVAETTSAEETVQIDEAEGDHPIAEAKAASAPAVPKTGKRAAIVEQAKTGALPTPPDFSRPTHARFRAKLAKLVELAEAGDVEGMKAMAINPVSTSPRAMARYRDLAIIAIEARLPAA